MGDTCIAARFGVRCQDGMIHLQALNRDAGSCFGMSRENTQEKETLKTEAGADYSVVVTKHL